MTTAGRRDEVREALSYRTERTLRSCPGVRAGGDLDSTKRSEETQMSIWTSLFKGREDSAAGAVPIGDECLTLAEENPQDPLARQYAAEELARRGENAAAVRHWLAAADIYMSQGFAVRAMAALV